MPRGTLVAKTRLKPNNKQYMYYLKGNTIMKRSRSSGRTSRVQSVRFKRQEGYLYYVKDGNVYRTRARGKPRGAVDRKPRTRRKVRKVRTRSRTTKRRITKRKPAKRKVRRRKVRTAGGLFGDLL